MIHLNRSSVGCLVLVFVVCYLLLFSLNLRASVNKSKVLPPLQATSTFSTQSNVFEIIEPKTPKIAYVFAGSVRSFVCPKVHWSIKSHLIDSLGGEPFVFVRVATEDNRNTQTGAGKLWNSTASVDEVKLTLEILNPVAIKYFSFSSQTSEKILNYPSLTHSIFRENDQRRYSMFYHRCEAYKMVLRHERENRMTFDWVVLARLDAQWLDPLPHISSYNNNRVWLTETGYELLNDQYMLIPRQFSDYIYDLDSKVQKNVYCLGGPDVEKWKCNRTELTLRGSSETNTQNTLSHCCEDSATNNTMGQSERIHMRHLEAGKIPISLARFPVLLTRLRKDGSCWAECERLIMNFKGHASAPLENDSLTYKYWAEMVPMDTRGRAISFSDHTKCRYSKERSFPWQPISAYKLHNLKPKNNHHPDRIDFSKPLISQQHALHKSILMPETVFDMWRIHPTWNVYGCLTFSFKSQSHEWSECNDHFKLKNGFTGNPEQSFFMQVIPHDFTIGTLSRTTQHAAQELQTQALSRAEITPNTTRIFLPNRKPKMWGNIPELKCLTVLDSIIKLGSEVAFLTCDKNVFHETQLFQTIQGKTQGSHHYTTVGQIRVALHSNLCVSRAVNLATNETSSGVKSVYNTVSSSVLSLASCDHENMRQQMWFEFEKVV